jgi:hypothetical protein
VVPLLALAFSLAPAAVAQEDLKKQLDELRNEVQKLKNANDSMAREQVELKAQLNATTAGDTSLEERINVLSESLDFAGTTVNSEANPIRIFGEFRTRSGWTFDRDYGLEFGDEDFEDDDGSFVDARFLVGFDFQIDPDVKTRFTMQANGLYENGDTPADTDGNLSEIDLYEGYIEFCNIFGRKELGAREGRQEFVFGNEFQFGNNDFFSGETFDGSNWWWNAENWSLNFLWAKMAITDDFNTRDWPYAPAGAGDGYDDDELYSLYFTLKCIQDFVLDLYWIYFNGHNGGSLGTLGNPLGSPSTGDTTKGGPGFDFYYHTFGLRLAGIFSVCAGLDYNLEFAYQTGSLTDGPPVDDVEGFAIEGEVGLTFSEENRFRVYIRGMYAEGADDDQTGYIPLFPERHSQAGGNNDHMGGKLNGNRRARYGILDIIPMDNVWSIQLGLTFDPSKDWTLGLTVLYAEHDEEVPTAAGDEDGIGFEVDAFAEWRYTKHTTLGGGIGALFPDDGAPLKGGGFAGDDDDVAFLFFLQARVVF